LSIPPNSAVTASNVTVSQGSAMSISGGSQLTVNGPLATEPSSTITVQEGSTLVVEGPVTLDNTSLQLSTGSNTTLQSLDVSNQSQVTIDPGAALTVNGDLQTTNGSTISSSPTSTINVTGTATLAGTFNLNVPGSSLANQTENYPDLMAFGNHNGEFSGVNVIDPETQTTCAATATYEVNSMAVAFVPCSSTVEGPQPPSVPVGAIVGGVIGGVALLALGIALGVFLYKRNKRNRQTVEMEKKLANSAL